MVGKKIVFTKVNTAEFLDAEYIHPKDNEVVVETMVSTVSCGTEKANITGDPNVTGGTGAKPFPRVMGYSSAGVIIEKGKDVKNLEIGDRVICFWGNHSKYNTVGEDCIVKIEDEGISFEEGALSFIASFSMAAIRKTRLEVGESAIVMGLGLLGQLAVRLLRAAGAVPVIAVDPIENRRNEALKHGADYAFDPFDKDFAKKVKEVTGGGANVAIEVTGVGAGLDGVLDCMARFGRVALLGCTRNKEFNIDYYKKVHFPGITLVGAHTLARPEIESYPGYFTHKDDIKAVMKLCLGKRIELLSIVKETHKPEECTQIYDRLVNDKDFPVGVQFDWRHIK